MRFKPLPFAVTWIRAVLSVLSGLCVKVCCRCRGHTLCRAHGHPSGWPCHPAGRKSLWIKTLAVFASWRLGARRCGGWP